MDASKTKVPKCKASGHSQTAVMQMFALKHVFISSPSVRCPSSTGPGGAARLHAALEPSGRAALAFPSEI